MLIKFLLLAVVFAVFFVGFRHWRYKATPQQREWLTRAAVLTAASMLILLALSGRLHWLFALLGAALVLGLKSIAFLWRHGHWLQRFGTTLLRIPALRRLPLVRRLAGMLFDSTLQTRYLHVTLDASTGQLHGSIRLGRHQGAALEQLDLNALLETLAECQGDDRDSAALLAAYLDQRFGIAWRTGRTDEFGREQPHPSTAATSMTRDEALAILGLHNTASEDEIRNAHRRLIQRMHPDRGGSDYLATKINQAKALLLP